MRILNPVKFHPLQGAGNPKAKLTEEDVHRIRSRKAAGGVFYTELAAEYNVSPTCVRKAVQRKSWKHI